jgi:hypothetical protein
LNRASYNDLQLYEQVFSRQSLLQREFYWMCNRL